VVVSPGVEEKPQSNEREAALAGRRFPQHEPLQDKRRVALQREALPQRPGDLCGEDGRRPPGLGALEGSRRDAEEALVAAEQGRQL
jgi:hypothetical protein